MGFAVIDALSAIVWIAFNRLRVMTLLIYLAGGMPLWIFLRKAGIHASIAGVLLAFAIPFTPKHGSQISFQGSSLAYSQRATPL